MAAIPDAAPMKRLSTSALVMTSIYTLGVNAVWLSYNLFILPIQVQSVTSEATKGIVLGALVGISIGIAVIVNIIAGIISDHSNSRFGRRRPMMTWGMLLTLPFILLPLFFPLTLLTVSLAYIGMQVFTNVSSGAFQPTLADFVPEEQRGISAGYKGVFTLIGSAIGVGVITALFAANLQNVAYIVIAAVFLAMTLVNVFAMRTYDKPLLEVKRLKLREVLVDMFRIQKRSGGFFWFVFGSFLIYMGVSGFQFFGVYYIEGILHITRPDAVDRAIQIAGLLNLLIGMLFALAAGLLSDKLGRRNIIIFSVLIASVVGILFPFARTFTIFLFFSAFYAASNGVILSVDTALTSDLVPLEEAGKYMAYGNLAVGVANGIAPPIFGLILNFHGAPTLGSFITFFAVSSALFIISCIVMALKGQINKGNKSMHPLIITATPNICWLAPDIPYPHTVEDIAEEARRCEEAGARIFHTHAEGKWAEVIHAARRQTSLVIQCGMFSLPIPDRMDVWTQHADMISMIVSHHDEAFTGLDVHVLHPREELEEYMRLCNQYRVKPELEVWHAGSIWNMRYLIDRGLLPAPYFTTLFFGWPGGSWSPPTLEEYLYRRRLMPPGSIINVSIMGPEQKTILAAAILNGDHIRVGTEDYPYIDGKVAATHKLVTEAVELARHLGRSIASAAETRELLGIGKRGGLA